MRRFQALFLLGCLYSGPLWAQVPVTAAADPDALLASEDAALAANKRLVYDFWREVIEAGQLEAVPRYLAEGYIQHNPSVPTGRDGFLDYFRTRVQPTPVRERVRGPLVAIVAEGDLVVLSFVRQQAEPGQPERHYTTTWFEMFRVQSGRIVEHWDGSLKR